MSSHEPEYPGDPRHPEHRAYLLALGETSYAITRATGVAMDLLRVHHGVPWVELIDRGMTLGNLVKRMRQEVATSPVPGFVDFVDGMDQAVMIRNDLLHALPVMHGLHRREASDLRRVVNFFTIESVQEVRDCFNTLSREGGRLLYFDGGAAVRAYSG